MVPSVGIIIGSTRPKRRGRLIAEWIQKRIQQDEALRCNYKLIDLAEWRLPLFDEPIVPMVHTAQRDHTKAWSKEIKALDGFLFVTPQYNWGYPAVLKNSLDYLFHEWTGKPAGIITYGGHGGGKAAQQLQQVLQALRMDIVPPVSNIILPMDMITGDKPLDTVDQVESSFSQAAPEILRAAKLLEEKLAKKHKF